MNLQRMSNVSVIQAATIPAKPIKPKKALNILLGIILGAMSGLGYAFFSEYASQGLSTPESVEKRLGLPVLTTISYKK
jgi:capsular polysaccharide biosynthesis protein